MGLAQEGEGVPALCRPPACQLGQSHRGVAASFSVSHSPGHGVQSGPSSPARVTVPAPAVPSLAWRFLCPGSGWFGPDALWGGGSGESVLTQS